MVAVIDAVLDAEPRDKEGRERQEGEAGGEGGRGGEYGHGAAEDAVGEHTAAEDGDVRGANEGG